MVDGDTDYLTIHAADNPSLVWTRNKHWLEFPADDTSMSTVYLDELQKGNFRQYWAMTQLGQIWAKDEQSDWESGITGFLDIKYCRGDYVTTLYRQTNARQQIWHLVPLRAMDQPDGELNLVEMADWTFLGQGHVVAVLECPDSDKARELSRRWIRNHDSMITVGTWDMANSTYTVSNVPFDGKPQRSQQHKVYAEGIQIHFKGEMFTLLLTDIKSQVNNGQISVSEFTKLADLLNKIEDIPKTKSISRPVVLEYARSLFNGMDLAVSDQQIEAVFTKPFITHDEVANGLHSLICNNSADTSLPRCVGPNDTPNSEGSI